MMTIKEQIAEIATELDKTNRSVNLRQVAAKLAQLAADVQEPGTDVPGDVLEPLPQEGRKIALVGFIKMVAEMLQETN